VLRAVLWAISVLICVFLTAPTFIVVPLSLSTSEFLVFPPPGFSFHWYEVFFKDSSWTDAVVRSLLVAFGASAFSVIFGTAAAYGIVRGNSRLSAVAESMLVLPIIVPTVVYAVGAYLLAIRLDLDGQLWLLCIAHGILALPFVVLIVGASLRTSDPRLELAAQTLGAPRFRAYTTTTLRLTAPAVGAGALLSAIFSLDETVVALFLSPDTRPTLPVRMYSSIRFELDPLVPVAATVMIAGTILLGLGYAVLRILINRHR